MFEQFELEKERKKQLTKAEKQVCSNPSHLVLDTIQEPQPPSHSLAYSKSRRKEPEWKNHTFTPLWMAARKKLVTSVLNLRACSEVVAITQRRVV
jgi:hypothetical protein